MIKDILLIVIYLVAIKAVIGIHFPWERCDCCGRKFRDIAKERPAWLKKWVKWYRSK